MKKLEEKKMKNKTSSNIDHKEGECKTNLWDSLHRKELKGKLMYKSNQHVILSQEECNAAYRLAAALANHDSEDYRSLKFLEVKPRDEKITTKKIDKT